MMKRNNGALSADRLFDQLLDEVPRGSALEAWLRDGGAARVLAAITRVKKNLTTHAPTHIHERMQDQLVLEQFTPAEIHAPDTSRPAASGPAASGPSQARRAALLTERARMQNIVQGDTTFGQKSMARGRIKAINAELAGNADQKEVVKWIKARTRKTLGAFDPDVTAAAFQLLPAGWSVTKTTALLPFPTPAWTEGKWRYIYRYERRVAQVAPPDAKGRPIVPDPQPGVLYTSAAFQPHDERYDRVASPLLTGVEAWLFTAPDGVTFVLPDRRERKSDPVTGDAFYKWAYTQGLAIAAAAALATAEAAVPRAAATEAITFDTGTCSVHFGVVSLAPKSRHALDHGYKRPGWGYNVSPCPGSTFPAYEASSAGTQAYLDRLESMEASFRQTIATLRAGRNERGPLVFRVKQYVLDAKGGKVREPDEGKRMQYGEWKVEDIDVPPGHALWTRVRDARLKQAQAEHAAIVASIPFYRAAVRLWRRGGVPYEQILGAVNAADRMVP